MKNKKRLGETQSEFRFEQTPRFQFQEMKFYFLSIAFQAEGAGSGKPFGTSSSAEV